MAQQDRCVLVVGAGGGIGSALLDQAHADVGVTTLIASARHLDAKPHSSLTHTEAPSARATVHWLAMDYGEPASMATLADQVAELTPRIDLLLCASGQLAVPADRSTHGVARLPEKQLADLDMDWMMRSYQVNAAGPVQLVAALAPLLKAAQAPVVGLLSAQVGSIADNQLGGWYSYRMAKAALNMGVKTLSVELSRWRNDACITAIHPGTTLTPLSEPFVKRRRQPVRTPTETAEKIYRLVQGLDKQNNGSFLTLDGIPLPW